VTHAGIGAASLTQTYRLWVAHSRFYRLHFRLGRAYRQAVAGHDQASRAKIAKLNYSAKLLPEGGPEATPQAGMNALPGRPQPAPN
jgi:hypothetical protein